VTRIREIDSYAASRIRPVAATSVISPMFAAVARLFRRRPREA